MKPSLTTTSLLLCTDTHSSDVWVLDTGASYHMTPRREWFLKYTEVLDGKIKMANDFFCKIAGIGSIKLRTHDGRFCTLNEVRHVPSMTKNLISMSLLDSRGFKYSGGDGVLNVCKGSDVILKGFMNGTLYLLKGTTITGSANLASPEISEEDITKLWHMRLGHMGERGMQLLSKQGLLCGHKTKSLEFCEHCVFGKLHRKSFRKAIHRTKGTLDYIHSDCWGPSRVESLKSHRYFVSMIDDYLRKTWIIFMKHKSEAFSSFKEWKILVENQTEKNVKRLRTDNGLEFCSVEFNQFCKDAGIATHLTVRETPQQNGVAERMNQTLLERARCMLSNAGLEKRFWAEAVNTACYLINLGPHTGIECRIPSEVWSGRSADYSILRVFGCTVYYHVSEGKLEPRARKGVFMGYGDGVKGYRVWSPSENRVILSRNVVFDEASMVRSSWSSSEAEKGSTDKQVELRDDHDVINVHEHTENQEERVEEVQLESTETQPPDATKRSIAKDPPRRVDVRPPERYRFDDMVGYALQVAEEVDTYEPSTYMEAVSCPEYEKWHAAMGDEMESHEKNHTWDLVTLPPGRRVVTCKWIYKIKDGASPIEGVKYKSRVVVRGFSQREGVDYNEIFSPVVRHTSIRVLLALVAHQDLELG